MVGTTNTVTLEVTDMSGNTHSCTTVVTVDDAAPIQLNCPADETVDTDAGVCTAEWTLPNPFSGGNCDPMTVTFTLDNGGAPAAGQLPSTATFQLGQTEVSYTIVDDAGATATCFFTVNVEDNENPTVTCPGPITLASCSDVIPTIAVTASDNCTASPAISQTPGAGSDAGDVDGHSTTVTVTATDDAGNSASCDVVVTIDDTTAPNALCADDYEISLDDEGNAEIADASSIDNGSSDDCAVASLALDVSSFDCTNVGDNTVTLTVTDTGGNAATCTTTVSVVDATAPEAVCQDITVDLAPTSVTISAADVDGGSTDACGVTSTTIDEDTFDCDDLGDNNVTMTVTDVNGNTAICVATVTVRDVTNPTVTCPADIILASCDDVIPTIMVTATDNCDTDVAITQTPGAGSDAGDLDGHTTTVTVTGTDDSGNSSSCTVDVIIDDTTAPIAQCADDYAVSLDDDGIVEIADASSIDNGSEDDCSEVSLSIDVNTFDCTNVGDNTVTLTVTDAGGNASTCTTVVTIEDTTAPDANCQDLTVELDATGQATVTAAMIDANSTDACGVTSTTIPAGAGSFDCDDLGDNNIELTVTDANGNVSTCVATITVEDNIDPVITCTPTFTADAGADCTWTMMSGALDATATDNCSASVAHDYAAAPSDATLAGATFQLGTTVVVFTATDEAGNTASCETAITVEDNTAPVVTCPGDQTIPGDVNCEAILVDYTSGTATDNCDSAPNVTQSPAPGTTVSGSATVTLTATDAAGNAATCTFEVTVEDQTAPVALCKDVTLTLDASGTAALAAADIDNGSNDNCGAVTATIDAADESFDCSNVGNNVVVLTVTDGAGLVTTCMANVVVEDDMAPSFTCPDAQVLSSCDEVLADLTALVTDAADNCGIATITQTPPAGTDLINLPSSFDATVTVTDVNGNATSCDVNVSVDDDTLPVFENCPTTMVMVGNDVDECNAKVNWSIPVAMDDCIVLTVTQIAGPAPGDVVDVNASTTVTYEAADADGNTVTCSFVVNVLDTQDPQFNDDILLPGDVTVECDAVPNLDEPVYTVADANDNCGVASVVGPVNVSTQDANPNNCGHYDYTVTRTWTITDVNGNETSHVQIITVEDTTAPEAVCQDYTLVLDAFGMGTVFPSNVDGGSTDNCAAPANLTLSVAPDMFSCDDLGDNTVTLTVTDPCGNEDECDATVTVVEGIVPCTPEYDFAGSDPCVCLDNATTLDDGQFGEVIQIIAPAGQTIRFSAVSGLFTTASPAPPAAPIPVVAGSGNDIFTSGLADGLDNDGDGATDEADENIYYTYEGRFVEGIGYSGTVFGSVFTSLNVSLSDKCYYPTPVFTNLPTEFCLGTNFTIEVEDQFGGAGAGVATIFIDGVQTDQFDGATLGIGAHTIEVEYDAGAAGRFASIDGTNIADLGGSTPPYYPFDLAADGSPSAQADPGCISRIETTINVVETPTQVVCNDNVQISIDDGNNDCEVLVTPDMLLEGSYGCFDDYTVVITHLNGIQNSTVDANDVGATLNYTLEHPISGNSCWGTIIVEDKLAPVITCPQDITILCTTNPNNLSGASAEDCSAVTLEYTDAITQFDCDENSVLAEVIVRTHIATDAHGNQSECDQTISIRRAEIDDVVLPSDIDIVCNDAQFADGDYSPAAIESRRPDQGATHFGWPEIAGQNITLAGTGDICGIGIAFEDEIVNICPGSFKIVRTWTVFDWCPADPANGPVEETFVQYIKITDVAPSITINGGNQDQFGNYILSANIPASGSHPVCHSFGPLPTATVNGECNNITNVTIATSQGDITVTPFGGSDQTQVGIIPGDGLALEPNPGNPTPHQITYCAEDECGNISCLTINVVVLDNVAPVAVCDEITTVSLSSDGEVVLPASVLDDGSHDNCCLDNFTVKRMGQPDSAFGDSETFTCDDAGTVMVVFRATDCFDNSNDCMVEVIVEDKINPQISCPADATIDCDEYWNTYEASLLLGDFSVLDGFGSPATHDNCEAILSVDEPGAVEIDQCGVGTITREWSVTDPSGNSGGSCEQVITVFHVSDWSVMFPDDQFVECGNDEPDFGEPVLYDETCELLAVSHSDQIFTNIPGACYKLVRTWTVINWCTVGDEIDQEYVELPESAYANADFNQNGRQTGFNDPFDANAPFIIGHSERTFRENRGELNAIDASAIDELEDGTQDGYITYEQVILVNDSVAPEFVDCSIDDVCIFDGCTVDITLPTPDVMDCVGAENVDIEVVQTSLPGGANGFGYNNVPAGTYTVVYKATDNCGNFSVCETEFTVEDCKNPTPYCVDGLVIEIMNTNPPMVDVWASDFDAGSFDNCGVQCVAFSNNCNDTQRVFDCTQLGENDIQLWVQDINGNWDFCETFVTIQDNMDQCGGGLVVAGNIDTETGNGVGQVDVSLNGTSNVSFTTLDNGAYSFANLPLGGDYSVTPLKDINPTNGVSTFDLVLITKHVLGVDLLDSPYKIIAADANNSQSVSTFDLVVLRKLILLIDDNFANNTSWRFVDASYNFPDATDPWAETFPEVISFNNLDASVSDADFVGIKVGDVNGNAQSNSLLGADDRNTVGELTFAVADTKVEAGKQYQVNFTANDFEAAGYQFTLNFDNSVLDFVELVPAVAGEENFGFTLLEEGAITTSWNAEDVRLENGEVVFSLVFHANANAQLSNLLSVSSQFTAAEAYNNDGELLDVNLAFSGKVAGETFELYQNVPNPFADGTIIGFSLPESSSAVLTITDASGKVVKVVEGNFAKGYNEVSIERSELSASGVHYYKLESATDSATKKMIFLGNN